MPQCQSAAEFTWREVCSGPSIMLPLECKCVQEARVFWGKAAYRLIKVEDTDNRTTLTGGNAYDFSCYKPEDKSAAQQS
jgi:hypothetical protein